MATPTGVNGQPPRPEPPLPLPNLRLWQWVAGGACGILIIIAIILSSTDPSLTYPSVGEDEEDVTVECTASGDVVDYPILADPGSMPLHYTITSGEAAYDKWKEREDAQAADREIVSNFATSRGINADCLRAETARLHTKQWVLTGGVTLGIAFVWLSVERRRRGDATVRTAREGKGHG
ncbi:MAG TPA: hypothetical protein VK059_07995 [Nocardioidaceae bacterium]|nr:hypothetical protein [Nocardioidaceae bacterium]